MASGIERSKFIKPIADALGWTPGKLRGRLERADYHSPFTDLPRALRILQLQVPNQMPAVMIALEAAGLQIEKSDDLGVHQLALMPPAVPAPAAEQIPSMVAPSAAPVSSGGLVERLARMIPGDESFTDKRFKVRALLKKHGVDGRMKDEARAIGWLKSRYPEAAAPIEQDPGSAVQVVVANIETLPVEQSRHMITSLAAQLSEKDHELKVMQERIGGVNYFLDAIKRKLTGQPKALAGLDEEVAGFLFLAMAASKKPL